MKEQIKKQRESTLQRLARKADDTINKWPEWKVIAVGFKVANNSEKKHNIK